MATSTKTKRRAPIERTEHPHVIKSADTLGGEPRINDTRIPVRQIFNIYRAGTPAAEIAATYPPLTLAEVHDAISYGYDHPDEMEYYEEAHKLRNVMRDQDIVYVGGRLISRRHLTEADLPPGVPVYTWETLPKEIAE